MKTIKVLLMLQFVMLCVLTYKLVLEKDQTDAVPTQPEASPATIESSPGLASVVTPQKEAILDESRLRQIIRSEFSAYIDSLAHAPKEDPEPGPEIDPVENALRLEVVKQEIKYYIEMGEVSDAEMQELQMDISRLDPESRKSMMQELARALNSGELRGRF